MIFLLPKLRVGDPMRLTSITDISQSREDFIRIFDYYTNYTKLILTAFGVVGFIVSYQQKKDLVLSLRAWALIGSGVILLTGALILSILGQELLLKMIEQNVIDLSLQSLNFARWASYGCLILAAMLIGFFCMEVTMVSKASQN